METNSSYRRQTIAKNPYMFNGGVEYNETTQWYETPYRQYDPAIGRFGAIDPLTHSIHSINPYQYAFNDPIALNDPTGLAPNGGNVPIPMANAGSTEEGRAGFGGGSFFDGVKIPGITTGIGGPGSGYHWSDQYRSIENNAMLMSVSTFRGFYGLVDDYGNIDYDRASNMANQIAASQSALEQRARFESVLGVEVHDRYSHNGVAAVPIHPVTVGGALVGFADLSWFNAVSASPIQGSFAQGFGDGFSAGFSSTLDFFESLGTAEGWRSLGEGVKNFGLSSCNCAAGVVQQARLAQGITSYVQSLPDKSTYQLGYDLGFGTEKVVEGALFSKGAGMLSNLTKSFAFTNSLSFNPLKFQIGLRHKPSNFMIRLERAHRSPVHKGLAEGTVITTHINIARPQYFNYHIYLNPRKWKYFY